ncbi:complement C1s subcomponent-like [Mugil cephalus]|uniref:complement C1s subcomponent-like n=1 Tax=Mugil cephalus TaxID=48193 RepID=UPI001FB70A98|nr:complement C1s subcomponent-like [Mugil cephalus]
MLRLSLLLLLFSHSTYSMLLGWVESPGYPSGYLPHASLNWSRCAPKGHTLSIRLIHLDLEDSQDCENDAVKVLSNGNVISVLCGQKEFEELQSTVNPSLLSAPGGCLTLLFHSDFSNTKRHTGFRGFYTVQDFDECEDDPNNECTHFCHNFIGGFHCSCRHGYHLAEDNHTCTVSCSKDLSGLNQGDISTPSWSGSYAENANCQYTLSVENYLQLELHFNDVFDVEQSSDGQCVDALTIETPSGTLGPFCGNRPPPSPLLTHSNKIKIRFTSDGFGTNTGFTLHFTTRDQVCPAVVTSNSRVTPQKPEYDRGQTVTVTCDAGYVLNTQGTQDLSSEYEATCQSTGRWTPTYTCDIVDCGIPVFPNDGILQWVGSNTQYMDKIQFNCNSKYYALEGDDTYTCSASGEWVSAGGSTEMPKCIAVCGKPETFSGAIGRIWGGVAAKPGEIPWQLFIENPRGAASLINERWAVTAAHVVDGVSETSLQLLGGLIDVNTERSNAVNIESEKIIIHPGYRKGIQSAQTNYDNDIALIKFTSRVNFSPNLLPICLPEVNQGVSEDEQGTVSGWGFTEDRRVSSSLKYAHIAAYSLRECQRTPVLPSRRIAATFTNNMFCAGAQGTDSCRGDSGGPFVSPVLSGSRGPYYLTGIVSWGSPCRQERNKGYYTKVGNYVEWIKETMEMEDKS